jgi:putative oxidoreductase
MKKYPPIIAGILLGLMFVTFSIMFLLKIGPTPPPPPEGSPAAMFFGAFGSTGYMKFVKIFEFTGGILLIIPRLHNIGLLLLGPVIVNILAFHVFVGGGFKDLLSPMLIVIILLALYLLWCGRKNFAGLLN